MNVKKNARFSRIKNRVLYTFVGTFFIGYILFITVRAFSSSLFFKPQDRINIVVYGKNVAYYSLAIQESRDYVVYFPPELKIQVPGGYGSYRVGSVGKLIHLDKKPDLYRKTFSTATSSFVHYYFYPDSTEVYYGEGTKDNYEKLRLADFFSRKSNASFLDRVYLAMFVLNKDVDKFRVLRYIETEKIRDDVFFEAEAFTDKSVGLFFQKGYRNDKKNVQIVYNTNYATAETMANMLEGNGIRVNDITAALTPTKECKIKEESSTPSYTAEQLSQFLGCTITNGNTDVYDIILELGEKENEWEITESF